MWIFKKKLTLVASSMAGLSDRLHFRGNLEYTLLFGGLVVFQIPLRFLPLSKDDQEVKGKGSGVEVSQKERLVELLLGKYMLENNISAKSTYGLMIGRGLAPDDLR